MQRDLDLMREELADSEDVAVGADMEGLVEQKLFEKYQINVVKSSRLKPNRWVIKLVWLRVSLLKIIYIKSLSRVSPPLPANLWILPVAHIHIYVWDQVELLLIYTWSSRFSP